MAINFFEMFATLRMGIDILPETDPNSVAHTTNPHHIPRYTLRTGNGQIIEGSVDDLVEQAHWFVNTSATLFEDEYPVFTVE